MVVLYLSVLLLLYVELGLNGWCVAEEEWVEIARCAINGSVVYSGDHTAIHSFQDRH